MSKHDYALRVLEDKIWEHEGMIGDYEIDNWTEEARRKKIKVRKEKIVKLKFTIKWIKKLEARNDS